MRSPSKVAVPVLACLTAWPAAAWAGRMDAPELAGGVQQYRDGDFEAAALTLDSLVRRLALDPAQARQTAQAQLYLGAAYVGMGQEAIARAKFRQALLRDPDLRPSPDEFPQKVIRSFEAARESLRTSTTLERDVERGRGKTPWILAGLGAAGAAGLAFALGGERPNRPPTASLSIDLEGRALIDVTRVSFSASGSDPDGDPLSYFWSFGDGDVADGASVSHVYRREGTFEVALSVRDGLVATTAKGGVTARSLTGLWQSAPVVLGVQEYRLTQGGFAIFPEIKLPPGTSACGSSGKIVVPRTVSFGVGACFPDGPTAFALKLSVQGVVDSSLQSISGEISCGGQLTTDACREGASTTLPITLTRAP